MCALIIQQLFFQEFKTCTRMFTEALLITARKWENTHTHLIDTRMGKYYSHSGKLAQHIKGYTTALHDNEISFTDTGKPDSKEYISNWLHLQEVYKHWFTVKEMGILLASGEEEGDWGVVSLSILIQRISEPIKRLTWREGTDSNPKRQTRGSSCSWLQGRECRIRTAWKASGSVSPSSVAWVPAWFQQSRHPGRCQCADQFYYRPSYHKMRPQTFSYVSSV